MFRRMLRRALSGASDELDGDDEWEPAYERDWEET
jgi:hypothetical protein